MGQKELIYRKVHGEPNDLISGTIYDMDKEIKLKNKLSNFVANKVGFSNVENVKQMEKKYKTIWINQIALPKD